MSAGGIKRTGSWNKVRMLVTNLKSDCKAAHRKFLMQWGLKAEAIARGHISAQDLGWKALKASTLATKVRGGYSENILVMTSSYFSAITSVVQGDRVFAGVKKGSKHIKGGDLTSIAAVHEYGNSNTPARPLWAPTYTETMAWTMKNNRPADILINALVSKYGRG